MSQPQFRTMTRPFPSLLGSTLLATTLAAHAASWPNLRGPNHDGISTERLASRNWPASGPSQVWKLPTPGGFSSFSVSGGRAFTIVTRTLDGLPQETVVAIDAAKGTELWAFPIGNSDYDKGGDDGTSDNKGGDGPRSTPTVDGDRVYALSARLNLVCLDAATGKPAWTRDLLKDHEGRLITWQSAASPVIDGGLIFLAGGGEGQALLGIDKATGKTVWKGQDDKMTHACPVPTTIHGQRQVIFFTQEGLVSVKPEDGTVLWRYFRYNVSTAAAPVVSGDLVYCSAGYGVGAGLYRITRDGDTFTPTEVWRQPGKLINHWSTPVVHDGHLYGLFGFKQYGKAPLQCVELATGSIKWSKEGFGPGNVTLVDGHLVVLGDAGQLALVEATPAGYREKGRADILGGKCWSTPTYVDGRVYARSTTEGVCVELVRSVATR